jgi:hypothetical protein
MVVTAAQASSLSAPGGAEQNAGAMGSTAGEDGRGAAGSLSVGIAGVVREVRDGAAPCPGTWRAAG